MQILAGVLILIGFVSGVVALGLLIYILPRASPFKTPDWMTVLLRSYSLFTRAEVDVTSWIISKVVA
jgi:uncharacterized membrane protein YphA (DoxX/SURF4 family)